MIYNQTIVHYGQPKWYIMFLKEKKTCLKINTEQCFDCTSYQTIYRCIVIHQRQYINMSIVATLYSPHDCVLLENSITVLPIKGVGYL